MFQYQLLDYFFIASHVAIILFALFGWIPKRLRKWHLFLLILTLFSWAALGYFYGWGYCFWTDWHYTIRGKLGYPDPPYSFIKFLLDALTKSDWDAGFVDRGTLVVFCVLLILSIVVNGIDFRKRTDPKHTSTRT